MAAISLETGAVIVDEDVYATIKRPAGGGTRNELKKSHLIEALGISDKEWRQILVYSTTPSFMRHRKLTPSIRSMFALYSHSPGWTQRRGASHCLGKRRALKREAERLPSYVDAIQC
jgi:hypothetical protein